MIRIAVVEDEELQIEKLCAYLRRYQEETGEDADITVYRDGDGITSGYKAQFDIIFMDIQMKFVDGMTAAEEIRKVDSEVVIIFITNLAQYAIKGYEVGALDYILKPVSYYDFCHKLDRAVTRVKKREREYLTISVKGGIVRLDLADVRYIESSEHSLIFHTGGGSYVASGTMKAMEEKLRDKGFSRGNHCYLINLAYVEGIEDKRAIVKGEPLQLSRPRMSAFLKDLTKYWGDK